MKPYTVIAHTADIRLKVTGRDLEEIFKNALIGMSNILQKDFCKKSAKYLIKEKISIISTDSTTLLIDFLSKVLTLSSIKKAIFCRMEIIKFQTNYLEAEVLGNRVESFDHDIKAVTYHEAEIKKINKDIETIIIFDI